MPRAEQGLPLRELVRRLRLLQDLVLVLGRDQTVEVIFAIPEDANPPGQFALVWLLSVGRANAQCQVLRCRVRKGHVVDGDAGVQFDVVVQSPVPVFPQNEVFAFQVSPFGKRPVHALVEQTDLFVVLDHDRAPVVALVEGAGLLVPVLHEALVDVTKERPEEVAFIFVLGRHDLVEAFLTETLDDDVTPRDFEALLLKAIFLVEGGRVSAESAIRHAILLFEVVRAILARDSCDARGEQGLCRVV